MTQPAPQPFRNLSEEECWDLTVNAFFARLGTYDHDDIFITPINITTHEGKVYFRSATGSKLTRLMLDEKVTLQFDRVTEEYAYSVNIFGNARLLFSHEERQKVAHLGFYSWIETKKFDVVEITPRKMTGRHFYFKKS